MAWDSVFKKGRTSKRLLDFWIDPRPVPQLAILSFESHSLWPTKAGLEASGGRACLQSQKEGSTIPGGPLPVRHRGRRCHLSPSSPTTEAPQSPGDQKRQAASRQPNSLRAAPGLGWWGNGVKGWWGKGTMGWWADGVISFISLLPTRTTSKSPQGYFFLFPCHWFLVF